MTSSESPVDIIGLGAATPVGRSVLATAAAVRAGLSGFAQHPYMVNELGVPMTVAAMPWLDDSRSIAERIGDALQSAIDEALEAFRAQHPQRRVALMINLPPHRPGMPHDLSRQIGERLRQSLGAVIDRIGIATLGHAGCLWALHSARELLTQSPDSVVLVAGADSYLEPDVLEWLEATDQLHGGGERNNAWGFVPGEGAGAMLLATPRNAQALSLPTLAHVRGVGVGQEDRLIGSGEVCIGLGLTAALREALGVLAPGERLTDVYCDMNGEPYRADEFAFLVTRTRERFVSASDFVAPADCWGDVGAASVPLSIALACTAALKSYAKGELALVWASSVEGKRGAAVLALPASAA